MPCVLNSYLLFGKCHKPLFKATMHVPDPQSRFFFFFTLKGTLLNPKRLLLREVDNSLLSVEGHCLKALQRSTDTVGQDAFPAQIKITGI